MIGSINLHFAWIICGPLWKCMSIVHNGDRDEHREFPVATIFGLNQFKIMILIVICKEEFYVCQYESDSIFLEEGALCWWLCSYGIWQPLQVVVHGDWVRKCLKYESQVSQYASCWINLQIPKIWVESVVICFLTAGYRKNKRFFYKISKYD